MPRVERKHLHLQEEEAQPPHSLQCGAPQEEAEHQDVHQHHQLQPVEQLGVVVTPALFLGFKLESFELVAWTAASRIEKHVHVQMCFIMEARKVPGSHHSVQTAS